jgi:hypothetical protein
MDLDRHEFEYTLYGAMPTVVDLHKHKLQRAKYDVYIGRFTRYTEFTKDSKWGNPFTPSTWGNSALPMYEHYARSLLAMKPGGKTVEAIAGWERFVFAEQRCIRRALTNYMDRWAGGTFNLDELTGKVMGCWCINATSWDNPRCHGQVLMKLWCETYGDKKAPEGNP